MANKKPMTRRKRLRKKRNAEQRRKNDAAARAVVMVMSRMNFEEEFDRLPLLWEYPR